MIVLAVSYQLRRGGGAPGGPREAKSARSIWYLVTTTKTYYYCDHHKNLILLCPPQKLIKRTPLRTLLDDHFIFYCHHCDTYDPDDHYMQEAKSANAQCSNFSEPCLMSSIMQYHDHHHHHHQIL